VAVAGTKAARLSYMPRSTPRIASRSTTLVTAVALVAVTAVALVAVRGDERAPAGFALWRLRAGVPFSELEQRAWLEQRRKFACRPIVGRHQLCEVASAGLPTTGVPGTVWALVDTAGIVAGIQFRASLDTSRMVVQARRILDDWRRDVETLSAQWDSVARIADLSRPDDRRYWQTPDARASAWIVRDPIWGHTVAVTVADERALTAVRNSADLAATVLGDVGFSPGGEETYTGPQAGPPAVLGPAAERRGMPVCPAQFRLTRSTRDTAGARQLPSRLRLLERAVASAYPGGRLAVGDDELSLIRDSIPERVIAEPSHESYHGLAVYAMQLPDRARMAAVSDAPGLAAECRVPTELLLVKVDKSGAPAETFRLALDEEATVIRITDLEVHEDDDGNPFVLVEYKATYDTPEWLAEVAWGAAVHIREPRVLRRTPVAVGKKIKATGEERVARLSALRSSSDSVRVSFLEPTAATKTVVVAHREGAPFDTYKLLALF
jgi:hypothetical protein